ncbi:MAG: outer membrane protein assembly factor BamD [Bacteroidetes bacterium]|nr:outer membrane protein assembly factor BamD [Bacteroidota bacterium]
MFPKKAISISILILVCIFLISCSKFQKLLKSSDYELKYTKALEYYKKEDYYRAQQLLEELISLTRGSKRGEEVYFYYAYCYYGQENFILAGYHFRTFSKTYPASSHTEECEYLSAYCYYLDSPEPSLDQSNTKRAIDALQLFINRYPDSEKITECNELIDKLRDKLEIKSYNSARLYYDISDFKSAVIALKNSLKDYPDSQFREDILYYILKASYEYAENSIEKKQKERYQETINEYYALIDEFPETQYLKEAKRIYSNSLIHINPDAVEEVVGETKIN